MQFKQSAQKHTYSVFFLPFEMNIWSFAKSLFFSLLVLFTFFFVYVSFLFISVVFTFSLLLY